MIQTSYVLCRSPGSEYACSPLNAAGAGLHASPPQGGAAAEQTTTDGIAGWVIQNQKPIIINDLIKDKIWHKEHGVNPVYRSTLTAPLIVGQDEDDVRTRRLRRSRLLGTSDSHDRRQEDGQAPPRTDCHGHSIAAAATPVNETTDGLC